MELDRETLNKLVHTAVEARGKAYAPYSGFSVGAAALGGSETVYSGSNVENASYGLTVCAERVAVFNAVANGERTIKAVAVCADGSTSPCGACLQVMAEFAPKEESMVIILCTPEGKYTESYLSDFLPWPFSL